MAMRLSATCAWWTPKTDWPDMEILEAVARLPCPLPGPLLVHPAGLPGSPSPGAARAALAAGVITLQGSARPLAFPAMDAWTAGAGQTESGSWPGRFMRWPPGWR
jgi:hypothetical protein